MAYDPALTSVIVVAVVGGTAAILSASSEWELAHELSRATDRWTKLEVVRVYEPAVSPDRSAREEAMLQAHGYEVVPEGNCGPRPVAAPVGGTAVCYRRSRTP